MAAISPTTLQGLGALIVAKIIATVPRMPVEQSEGWKHYGRATDAANRTRRFRLVWSSGRHRTGGIFTTSVQEHEAKLEVRVDYVGDHGRMSEVRQDDWAQLRDVISQLSTDPSSGLVLCLQSPTVPSIVADSDHGRQRVSAQGPASSDAAQWSLPYDIRYLQARALAA